MKLIDFITEMQRVLPKNNHESYFRGHSNSNFTLLPSIYRDGLISNEDKIFKESIIRTPHEFLHCKSTLERLVKMQHYAVPTRLLDITSNPLVALYFACKDVENNGEVIHMQVPNDHVKFYDSDTVSVLGYSKTSGQL